MKKYIFISILISSLSVSLNTSSQVLTKEDSLNAGLVKKDVATFIGGYGEAAYSNDLTNKTASINLTRNVLFVGHKFNNKISLFTETEIEDAKVEGGDVGGEIALEQLFLKFNLNKNNYVVAGLFIPRIGIINENHLPTTFNSVKRPFLETKLIPATWRELGFSFYGVIPKINGLNYSLGLMNGLNAQNFETGKGIRSGRYEGKDANAQNLAIAGSLLYYVKNFRIQLSGYYGGTIGLPKKTADSLGITTGAFGTPLSLEEFSVQYRKSGMYFTGLVSSSQMSTSNSMDSSFSNKIPEFMIGFYLEAGYNLLDNSKYKTKKLNLFARYENFDLNTKIVNSKLIKSSSQESYLIAGIAFLPLPGIIIKADYIYQTSFVEKVLVSPPLTTTTYYNNASNQFFNIGIGYSF